MDHASIDLGKLASNPIALLAAAVVVLWIARALANIAFKIVLVLAVAGAVTVAGGLKLPAGMDIGSLASGMLSGVSETASIGRTLLQSDGEKENIAPAPR